jgi:uncharacterized membrane-anchored protein
MNLGLRIAAVVVLQTLALLAMVGMKQYTLSTGTPIVLETEPIDPRSLFSGDYVRLNYSISRLPADKLAGDRAFERGDTVYVLLRPAGEFWEALSVHHVRPAAAAGQIAIKGRVEYTDPQAFPLPGTPVGPVKAINVKYGVENYYVPEGEGRALERPNPDETISIRLVVDRRGNAAIKAVLVNGVERYVERLF